MQTHSIKDARQKIMVGTFSIYLILAVSLGASIAYWYILAGISTNQNTSIFWLFIIWLVVAVGLVAELIKKITLSTFRNLSIWLVATFVSVLTVMGTYSILDNQKQSQLVKQSDSYQMAKSQKAEAMKKQAQFAYAQHFNISDLEAKKREAGNKARWGTFNRLKKEIEAKKQYNSAVATLNLSSANMNSGQTGNISSNPLLSNLAKIFSVNSELLKSLFYLIVTLLLEIAAYWIGGQVEQLKQRLRLTEAEILDLKNKAVFGVSMQDFNRAIFENVVIAQTDQKQAEQQIEKLRKTSRKKLPANETIQQVKRLRQETQQQQKQAKKPPNISLENVPKKAQEKSPKITVGFVPQSVPKQAQKTGVNVPKQAQQRGTKKPLKNKKKARSTVTADTGTTGENSKRYQALKEQIIKGKITPTFRAIQGFKYGSRGMGRSTAEKYREALIKEGIIS